MSDPIIYWPASLPQAPLAKSYSHATGNNTIRTAMEFGPAKTRRRASAQPSILTAIYILQGDQKDIFLNFYDLVDCHMSFWLPDPENSKQYILVKIRATGEDQGVALPLYHGPMTFSAQITLEIHPHVPPRTRL